MTQETTSLDYAIKIQEMFRKRFKIVLAESMPKETTIAQIDDLVNKAAMALHQCGWDAATIFNQAENFRNTEFKKVSHGTS